MPGPPPALEVQIAEPSNKDPARRDTSAYVTGALYSLAAPPKLLVYGITASDLNDSRLEPHGPGSVMEWSDLAEWVRLRPRTAARPNGWALRDCSGTAY